MKTRRKGFTLIELLVVIAIIGILAAMLFPVFAKARESARKIQCLSNVKNIAMAIVMYTTEWEGSGQFFPLESNMQAILYFNPAPGGGNPSTLPDICNQARHANPYLREPVLLEEYIGGRDIWRCPSASQEVGAGVICSMGRDGLYLNNWIDNESWWPDSDVGPCGMAWPTGWGGEVTDSFIQRRAAPNDRTGYRAAGVFAESIGVSDDMHWANMSSVSDPARFTTCGDSGATYNIWNAQRLAFPDYCYGTSTCGMACDCPEACSADWVNCSWTQSCGLDTEHKIMWFTDPAYRKTLTRHLGGSNVGFLDGHAKWFMADTIMFQGGGSDDPIQSLCACWWTPACGGTYP